MTGERQCQYVNDSIDTIRKFKLFESIAIVIAIENRPSTLAYTMASKVVKKSSFTSRENVYKNDKFIFMIESNANYGGIGCRKTNLITELMFDKFRLGILDNQQISFWENCVTHKECKLNSIMDDLRNSMAAVPIFGKKSGKTNRHSDDILITSVMIIHWCNVFLYEKKYYDSRIYFDLY